VAITGVHAILFSHDAPADRAFLANVLGLASVDAGEGRARLRRAAERFVLVLGHREREVSLGVRDG
jgi:hypothetical protein